MSTPLNLTTRSAAESATASSRAQSGAVTPEPPTIDADTRTLIGAIADRLMPDHGVLPSVEQADTAGHYLDVALAARPDLVDRFFAAIDRCQLNTIDHDLAVLRGEQGKDWEILTTILPAAYLMNPEVRRALGYQGQTPQPIQSTPQADLELVDAVRERGPIYRPTP